ncbi:MAG: glycosyltransferase [Gemmataceae bacterium]|nr:glycosyltransferase [Gemmataceae bacterium]
MTTISLCVPTYNRAEKLSGMLPALLAAVVRHPQADRFEVCISDNGSPDDTAHVIEQAQGQFASVRMIHARQTTNLGFAGNFEAVARMATGESFVILADDDTLRPDALDWLLLGAARINVDSPLVMFDTLPGADAVRRGIIRPTVETTIDGPDSLLSTLGIFHASFVSNLMFHREAALTDWPADVARTRYPHTMVALKLLRDRPAIFLPGRLVNVTLPPDTGEQPLLAAIDMARLQSDFTLGDPRCRDLRWRTYSYLMQMIPTAVYLERTGRCLSRAGNPFAELTHVNVRSCYRQCRRARFAAGLLYACARSCPLPLLRAALRKVSRHPR